VTSEGRQKTEQWIESKGAEYAYAYDQGGKLKSWFGIRGIPHAVLVDATGTIVWRGHPGKLTEEIVEESLGGALRLPMWEWPEVVRKKVGKYFLRRQSAKALAEAEKLGETAAPVRAELSGLVAGLASSVRALHAEGNYLSARLNGERCKKELAGLPQADEIEEVLRSIKADKQAQTILKAQQKVRKTLGGKIKKASFAKHEKAFRKIMQDLPGTVAAREAQEGLKTLQEMQKG